MKMKFFLLLLFFQSAFLSAKAQRPVTKDFTYSAGVDMGYAVGRFHLAHRLGYGLSVQGEYLFADNSAVTLNTGYISFVSQKYFKDSLPSDIATVQLVDFSTVPFLIGVKMDNEGKFYVHPQVGVALRSKTFISASYALAVGVVASRHADFSLRYQAVHKKGVIASFLAVRASYIF